MGTLVGRDNVISIVVPDCRRMGEAAEQRVWKHITVHKLVHISSSILIMYFDT